MKALVYFDLVGKLLVALLAQQHLLRKTHAVGLLREDIYVLG